MHNVRGRFNTVRNKLSTPLWITLLLFSLLGVGTAVATSLTLSDGEWVGLGASAGRMEVDDAAQDVVFIADAHFGINTSTTDGWLHVFGGSAGTVTASTYADDAIIENSGTVGLSLLGPDANSSLIYFGSPSDNVGAGIQYKYGSGGADKRMIVGTNVSGGDLSLRSGNGTERAFFDGSSGVVFNESGADYDLRVGGDTRADLLLVDAGDDSVEVNGMFGFSDASRWIGIASNQITVTHSSIVIKAETGGTDDLETINGGDDGDFLVLTVRIADTITVKSRVDNICLNSNADFTMSNGGGGAGQDTLFLMKGTVGAHACSWVEIARSDN